MKKKCLFIAAALLSCSFGFAQRTPTHALDIKDANFNELATLFDSWTVGSAPQGVTEMDDEFYISRVRPLKRIADGDYQAVPGIDPNRKMCLWVPLDDPTSKWKALPRYCLEGDNFSMWSYIDIHGNWTAPWLRATAGLTDVAHKNGVKVGCVLSIPWGQYVSQYGSDMYSRIFNKLTEKDKDGNFIHSLKLVKLMKYYGIDGIGCNSEFRSSGSMMSTLIDFFADCHVKAKEIGWEFQLHWYDGTNDNGQISFDNGLGDHNDGMFGTADKVTTDMLFFNYNWYDALLSRSVTRAEEMGRSSYDLYAGFDIQGRALKNTNWDALDNNKVSIGFWGAHSQSLLHQSATDDGTADLAIQKAYLQKQELVFSGGYRNPAKRPGLNSFCDLSNASLKNFHGLARFLTAKSTIQQVPFVSRFNLGNGLKFRNEGKVTFDHKWHNLNTQDFMPTWRWWITDAADNALTDGAVNAEMTFDDAYFGGTCLRLNGQTSFSRVKLFKTMLKVEPSYNISVTYKMKNELATRAKLFVALKGDVTSYKEIDIPAAAKFGEWATFTAPLSSLGIASGDQVAMIGIAVSGTPSDYEMLVGEIALRDPAQTFGTVQPTIKEVEVLRGYDNTVDFKMRYASKDEAEGEKTYNDEVGTWYYEIWFQQTGHEPQLITATTSWAAYVIDAPIASGFDGRQARFGVRAVSPDGLQKSGIAWTAYQDIPYDTPSSEVVIDKQVVKPGETFTVKLEDEMASPAQKWEIVDPLTGNVLFAAENKTSFEAKIDRIGAYDVAMVDSEGKRSTLRGKVHITPEATGAVPEIQSLTVDKATAETGQDVAFAYASRDGEGSVSRAVAISDPKMLQIPADVQKGKVYSYALWVKIDNYAHDKQGTNLINKNTVADKWPHNNWGDLWVTIRPAGQCSSPDSPNEVSFNTFGFTSHDEPNYDMMTKGYSLNPGLWNHIVVTCDNTHQKMYFNGKKVADAEVPTSSRRDESTDSRIDRSVAANIYIGGGGVYKAGLNGWVDEVQIWNKALTDDEVVASMNGYAAGAVPEGLQGYYTFEEYDKADSTFANYGRAGAQYKAKIVVMEGSGGESTASAAYKTYEADNSATGYPGVEGTLPIVTTHKWTLDGARISSDADKAAIVTYALPGTYSAALTLENAWGTAEKSVANIVEITEPTGISDATSAVADFALYPNPFAESVNLRFAQAGAYTINVFGADGTLVQQNRLTADAGSVANVAISGKPGMYIVSVVKDGKQCKAVRVVKK